MLEKPQRISAPIVSARKHIMVDNKQGIGLEKAQGEGIQQSKKVMASKEKIVVPENIQCDSSESGNGSLQVRFN